MHCWLVRVRGSVRGGSLSCGEPWLLDASDPVTLEKTRCNDARGGVTIVARMKPAFECLRGSSCPSLAGVRRRVLFAKA